MLAHALKVVEAARVLGIQPGKAGIYHASCDPLHIPRAMREIAQSIQDFDRATAHGEDAKAMLGRALRYAASRGIDPRDMMRAIGPGRLDAPEAEAPEEEASADLAPRPGEIGAPDRPRDIPVDRQARLHGDAVTGKGSELPPAFASDPYFPGQTRVETIAARAVGLDGEDDDAEAALMPKAPRPPSEEDERRRKEVDAAAARMQEIARAEERLAALAQQHGWTPALKKVDAELRRAYGAMETVVSGGAAVATVGADAERILAFAEKALRRLEDGDFDIDDPEAEGPVFAPR